MDICSNYHGGNAESVAANPSESAKDAIRDRIEAFIGTRPSGMICDEIEVEMALSHQTTSARITELVADGRITRTLQRRPTRTGRNAAVLVTPEHWHPEMGIWVYRGSEC